MKSDKVIGFRPEQDFYDLFIGLVEEMGIDKTELAERAVKKGLFEATEEIRKEKLAQHKQQVEKLRKPKIVIPSFNLAPAFLNGALG
jgi:hypothetical protein